MGTKQKVWEWLWITDRATGRSGVTCLSGLPSYVRHNLCTPSNNCGCLVTQEHNSESRDLKKSWKTHREKVVTRLKMTFAFLFPSSFCQQNRQTRRMPSGAWVPRGISIRDGEKGTLGWMCAKQGFRPGKKQNPVVKAAVCLQSSLQFV